MTLTIGDDDMSSDRIVHTSRSVVGENQRWQVSWLPGRYLDRNSAISAMILADATGPGDIDDRHRLWPHIEGSAVELGLTAPDVITRTADRPSGAVSKTALPTDPEVAG